MRKFLTIVMFTLIMTACSDNKLAPNGHSCAEDDDCQSDMCLLELDEDVSLPGGLCTDECDAYAEEGMSGCDELAQVCLIYTPTWDQYCYDLCSDSDDCRESWTCYDVGGSYETLLACIPESVL